jgi:hypothetical protein
LYCGGTSKWIHDVVLQCYTLHNIDYICTKNSEMLTTGRREVGRYVWVSSTRSNGRSHTTQLVKPRDNLDGPTEIMQRKLRADTALATTTQAGMRKTLGRGRSRAVRARPRQLADRTRTPEVRRCCCWRKTLGRGRSRAARARPRQLADCTRTPAVRCRCCWCGLTTMLSSVEYS